MTDAYKCDMCGEFEEGKPPITTDFRIWLAERGEEENSGRANEYCSHECFENANHQAILNVMMDGMKYKPKFNREREEDDSEHDIEDI